MRRIRFGQVITILFFASWLQGATGVFKEFPVSSPNGSPSGISSDHYGHIVYADVAGNKLVRLSPDGTTLDYAIPTPNAGPAGLSADYAGNVWFTEFSGNKIGRLSQAGTLSEFAIPTPGSGPLGILANFPEVWFTEFLGNKIGKITQDGTITEFPIPSTNSGPTAVSPGYDAFDVVVFTERNANRIGTVGFDGSIREFPIPTPASQPMGIAPGADGYYFAEFAGNKIGRAEFGSLAVTEYPLPSPGSGPRGIALRSNLNEVWFTEELGNRIGRLSPGGAIAEFAVPTPDSHPTDLSPPADFLNDYLWFSEQNGHKIGRVIEDVVAVTGGGSSGTWDTRVELANVEGVERGVHVGENLVPYAGPLPSAAPPCAAQQLEFVLAPNGSVSDTLGAHACRFLSTLFINSFESDVLPSVRARIFNISHPSQIADLPAARLSRIAALDPQTLAFPVSVGAGTEANLVLSDVSLQDSLSVSLVAYSSQGELLASATAATSAGATMILPVLSFLGLSELDGQIRVTKLSGTGWMWGTLVTVAPDGTVSAILGIIP